MKRIHVIAGLLIIGLLAHSGLAKSKSRNGRTQRQAYLPPHASNRPQITEEYITIHEESAPSGQTHFQESNYGGGKYQIFEIHSHYEPAAGLSGAHSGASGYLPPRQEIRVEHVHQATSGNHQGSSQHIAAHASAPAAPAAHGGPSVQEEVIRVEHIHVSQVEHNGQQAGFKAPDYLPPHEGNSHAHASLPQPPQEYRGPDYLPPHGGGQQHVQSRPSAIQSVSHQQQTLPHHQVSDYRPSHFAHQSHQNEQHFSTQNHQHFGGPDYLPPHQEHQHATTHEHLEHHQHLQQSHHHQQQHYQSEFKGPDYLPPHQQQPNYHESHQQVAQQQNALTGPDYLPPHQSEQGRHHDGHQQIQTQSFKGPDYLPPHQTQAQFNHHHEVNNEVHHQVQQQHNAFQGPDYLPPHETPVQHNHHQHEIQQSQPNSFKGPDYLPPHQHQGQHIHQSDGHQQAQQQPQLNSFKGPDYLPPHQHQGQHIQQPGGHQQAQQQPQLNSFKGPDYLPPHQDRIQQSHQQVQQQPEFLQTHSQLQVNHLNLNNNQLLPQPTNSFRAPDYLPPHQTHHDDNRHQPGALPSGYEPQIPAVPAPQPLPQPIFQHPLPQPAPQPPVVSNLPAGYDFEKPENSEQAIAELHTLPDENVGQQEVVVQSQIQVAQGPQQADIIYGSRQPQLGGAHQANGYLPPHQTTNNYQVQQTHVQTVSSAAVTQQQSVEQHQHGLQQVAPQTFGPPPATPVEQAPVSNYLPPATPVQAHQYSSNLHSLSSYMTSVEPFQRYASAPRQPFREYGPPPNRAAIAQQQQQPQPVPPPVAPMYREPSSRPQHYAPAMSYATNALANSNAIHHTPAQHQHVSFNQQTRDNLQQFMPKDITRLSPVAAAPAPAPAPAHVPNPSQPAALYSAPAVPARQSTSSKIRTVQILNPAAVKTLKVLETSDHTGVKTIKILGHSNTQPTGDHHVVRVVTQNAPNANEHVQTVKIFNDHEDVHNYGGATGGGNGAPSAGGNAAYLPPSVRVARQSPIKLQLLSNRRPFTGRQRYRL